PVRGRAHPRQRGHRLREQVLARPRRPGAGGAVPRRARVDEPRVHGERRPGVEADAFHHARAAVLDQHVRARRQLLHPRPAARRPLALVTGASRGIGAAVARALAPTHDLLLGGRDADALGAVAADLAGARAWPVDLTDPGALATAVAGIDRLDVLVHSAGIGPL